MVQVNLHLVVSDFYYFAKEALSVLVLQWDDGVNEDVFLVQFAVDAEHLLFEAQHSLCLMLSVSLLFGERKFEILTLLKLCHVFFEVVKRQSHAADKLEWSFCWSFFHHVFCAVFVSVQLVCYGDVLVFLFFHYLIYCFFYMVCLT